MVPLVYSRLVYPIEEKSTRSSTSVNLNVQFGLEVSPRRTNDSVRQPSLAGTRAPREIGRGNQNGRRTNTHTSCLKIVLKLPTSSYSQKIDGRYLMLLFVMWNLLQSHYKCPRILHVPHISPIWARNTVGRRKMCPTLSVHPYPLLCCNPATWTISGAEHSTHLVSDTLLEPDNRLSSSANFESSLLSFLPFRTVQSSSWRPRAWTERWGRRRRSFWSWSPSEKRKEQGGQK